MKDFINEYGLVIVAVVLVLIFLAFATPLGKQITESITELVEALIETAEGYVGYVNSALADADFGQLPSGN